MVIRRRLFHSLSGTHVVVHLNTSYPSIILSCADEINSAVHVCIVRVEYPTPLRVGRGQPWASNAYVVYDLPHVTRHAMPKATGNQRSMCGQRKYLAGKRQGRLGKRLPRRFPFFLAPIITMLMRKRIPLQPYLNAAIYMFAHSIC